MQPKRRYRVLANPGGGALTLYTPDGARDLAPAAAAFVLELLMLDPADRSALAADLARALGRPQAPPPTGPAPRIVAPGRASLPPWLATKAGALSSLARQWHDTNFRLRAEHTGHQLDQRTIAKLGGFAEHRHGTRYFREMEEAGLGRYEYGRFYYHGETWSVGGGAEPADDAPEAADARQGALL